MGPYQSFYCRSICALLILCIHSLSAKSQAVTYYPPYNTTYFNSKPIDQSRPVGVIDGTANVSLSGGATYSIPIKTLPSVNGMAPNISINYNSQAGSGIAGYGWSIGGLSIINRVPFNHYFDNKCAPTGVSDIYNLAIDGSRLLKTGTAANGLDRFTTEQGNYSYVEVINLNAGGGYEGLRAVSKNGIINEYGTTTYARKSAIGNADENMMWWLDKSIDESGNYIDYTYTSTNDERLLTKISYTGNSTIPSSPPNSIEFIYSDRDDQNTFYAPRHRYSTNKLLTQIVVKCGTDIVYLYNLRYSLVDGKSVLYDFSLSGANGDLINSTVFKYDGNDGIAEGGYLGSPAVTQDQDFIVCDFNGDGLNDIIDLTTQPVGACAEVATGFKFYKGNTTGANFSLQGSTTFTNQPLYKDIQLYGKSTESYNGIPIDFNNDGSDDILTPITEAVTGQSSACHDLINVLKAINISKYQLGAITTTTVPMPNSINNYKIAKSNYYHLGDFDGDASADVLFCVQDPTSQPDAFENKLYIYSEKSASNNQIIQVSADPNDVYKFYESENTSIGDYDGDGDQEIYILKSSVLYIFDVELVSGIWTLTMLDTKSIGTGDWRMWLTDLNGDGISDVFAINKANNNKQTFQIRWGTGTDFTTAETFDYTGTPAISFEEDRDHGSLHTRDWIITGDFNGDNLSDIMWEYKTNASGSMRSYVRVYYNNGKNTWSSKDYNQSSFNFPNGGGLLYPVDINGDNRLDIVTSSHAMTFRPNYKDKLITDIKDGFNKQVHYDYCNLNVSNYSQDAPIPYGYDYLYREPRLTAVSSIITDANLFGIQNNTTNYTYKNAMFNRYGKGFLGFESIESINTVLDRKINTRRTFHYVDIPSGVNRDRMFPNGQISKVYTASGTPISTTTNRIGWVSYGPPMPRAYKIYETNDTVTNHLSGNVKTTHGGYDFYGNLENNIDIINNGYERHWQLYFIAAASSSMNYSYPYKVSTKIVSDERNGVAVSNKTNYGYFPNGTIQTITNYVNEPKSTTTTYVRNAWGCVTSESVSATSLPTITNTYAYDIKSRFVIKKTNPLNKYESFTYDSWWGKITSATGYDKNTTTYTYDQFGGLLSTTSPEGTITNLLAWDYNTTDGRYYRLTTTGTNGSNNVTIFDGLGRDKISFSAIIDATVGGQTSPQYSYVDKTYDAKGNLASVTAPHVPGETFLTTNYQYDDQNRIKKDWTSLNTNNHTYTYSSGNLIHTTTNSSGQSTSSTTDPAGRLITANGIDGVSLTYIYNGRGDQLTVKNGSTALTSAQYDIYGKQTQMVDIAAGTYQYDYNAYGQLNNSTDPNGYVQTYTYDLLGRILTRIGTCPSCTTTHTTTYDYYNGVNTGEGFKVKLITDFNGSTEEYKYNTKGYVSEFTEYLDGSWNTTTYTYDSYGRLLTTTYPTVFAVTNEYNSYGLLTKVKSGTTIFYQINKKNGLGLTTECVLGSNTQTNTYSYGRLTRKYSPSEQDYRLTYDNPTTNILTRKDNYKGITETFTYNTANKLTNAVTTTNQVCSTSYTSGVAPSTFNTKTDAGGYVNAFNGQTGKISLSPTGLISNNQQDIVYTKFHRIESITENGWKQEFTYGHDYERRKSDLYYNNVLVETRLYLADGLEVIKKPSTPNRLIHYISSPDGLAAIYKEDDGVPSGTKTFYVYTDHLGTIQTLYNTNSTKAYEQSFNAWGLQRDPDTWATPYTPTNTDFSWLRGFTGHEHMPQFSLINMNARLYDPITGRMLSPDGYVANITDASAFDRYSYAGGNPLSYTDPTGNFLQAGFFGIAFIAELSSNLISGYSNPVGNAYNTANGAVNDISNVLQVPIYTDGKTKVTAGIDPFSVGVSARVTRTEGDFSFGGQIGVGLFSDPSATLFGSYKTGNWTFAAGGGTNFNTYSIGGGAYFNDGKFSAGYGYTRYGGSSDPDFNHSTGTFSIGYGGVHFSIENDFLAIASTSDKGRTQGLQIGYGSAVIGSHMLTNDGERASGGAGHTDDRESPTFGPNKHGKKAWLCGEVYRAPIYFGHNGASTTSRIGYSHWKVQDLQQNWMHQSFFRPGNQNYYVDYGMFKTGTYLQSGLTNQFSLFDH